MTTQDDTGRPEPGLATVITGPDGLVLAIDADCPSCGHWERTFTVATGLFGCTQCTYTSPERTT